MMTLSAFIAGVIFCSFLSPLLEVLSATIEARANIYITKCGVKTSENQVKIRKISTELEDSHVSAIGFRYEEPESELDDFFEEDKYIGKIGF